uniref:Uncharacterized protein n=1 Tax=Nymphaea colorata TaxID=210225 RepID=A0A5K1C2E5_9MAGN
MRRPQHLRRREGKAGGKGKSGGGFCAPSPSFSSSPLPAEVPRWLLRSGRETGGEPGHRAPARQMGRAGPPFGWTGPAILRARPGLQARRAGPARPGPIPTPT